MIPDSVTSIGDGVFYACNSLTAITIQNPECKIYDSEVPISDTATIHGYADSTAQAYAEKYGREFVALEGGVITTTTAPTTTTTQATTTTTKATTIGGCINAVYFAALHFYYKNSVRGRGYPP